MKPRLPTLALAITVFGVALMLAGAARGSAILQVRPMFPPDHVWNTRIDSLPLDANSAAYVSTIGAGTAVHADFGTVYNGAPNGIPYITVAPGQTPVAVTFDYADESDPGPYPIPPGAPIEGGPNGDGDRHVLVVDGAACKLYETWDSHPNANGSWHAGSGAVFDLCGYALRPLTWTSADAAGLPILPGLVRYEEVAAGEIAHALRFTVPQTRNQFVWPARHQASSRTGSNYPPMGQRFRLKASVNITSFGPNVQIILRALKKYGMFLADNGSSWYLSGAPDPRWSDDELHQLGQLHGSDFEAVDESSLMIDVNSGRASLAASPATTASTTATVVEFYRQGADHYFMTSDEAEIAALDAQPAWVRTGQTFKAIDAAAPARADVTPVCRLYGLPSAGLDSHFYSASRDECTAVAARYPNTWLLESANVFGVTMPGTADGACPDATIPLYRSYDNRADANHRYTTSPEIQARMIATGWLAEGFGASSVAMCVPR